MKRPITVEDILGLVLRQEIQKELNRDIISHLQTGTPLESTPMMYENVEQEKAAKKHWARNERWWRALRKRVLADPDWKHWLEA